jgi:hypothetical protein
MGQFKFLLWVGSGPTRYAGAHCQTGDEARTSMRLAARSTLLGCLTALLVWSGAALGERPITFYSATPDKPVIAEKWADVPKLYPKTWPEQWGQWIGKPCLESGLLTDLPVEFRRLSGGPVVAIVPCLGIGNELWVHVNRNFEVVPLPMPSGFPDGGFTVQRNTGLFAWNTDSSAFTITTTSDLIPFMQRKMTYAVGSSVQSIRLLKVESALYTGLIGNNLEWMTEWVAQPWRSESKGP